jgi:hypothetical protein
MQVADFRIKDPDTVWLRDLVVALEDVASSTAGPDSDDAKAFAQRLEAPVCQRTLLATGHKSRTHGRAS